MITLTIELNHDTMTNSVRKRSINQCYTYVPDHLELGTVMQVIKLTGKKVSKEGVYGQENILKVENPGKITLQTVKSWRDHKIITLPREYANSEVIVTPLIE